MMDVISWRVLRRAGAFELSRRATIQVDGIDHVPPSGPVLIAARHYHHLLDGCALVKAVDRPLHVVVGLDWVEGRLARRAMDGLCRAARWPIVLRPAHQDWQGETSVRHAADRDRERRSVLRTSARETTSLLAEGRAVVVFPEGYPNIDPSFTPKSGDEFLSFQPGFVRYARIAEWSGAGTVPIVPAGFAYERSSEDGRWRISLRFGAPIRPLREASDASIVQAVESAVRELSRSA